MVYITELFLKCHDNAIRTAAANLPHSDGFELGNSGVSHELNFPTFAVLCRGRATLTLNSSLNLWDRKKTVKYL